MPMVGDQITFLDCTSCQTLETCAHLARTGSKRSDFASHTRKGTVIQVTSSNFAVKERPGMYKNISIVQIRRDIIAEAKAQEAPDNIIPLDF